MSNKLIAKLEIIGKITLITGLHIGASNDFAPIGAVDSVVVRDPLTKLPIIPGSSLKGKLRTLLAKILLTNNKGELDWRLPDHDNDDDRVKRLFGCEKKPIVLSRLQFLDLKMSNKTAFDGKNLDLNLSEIKFENTINRKTAEANPRQIERVPAGAEFKLSLIYNFEFVENKDKSIKELQTDLALIADAFKLLEYDYLGGNGTRGYGKVTVNLEDIEPKVLVTEVMTENEIKELLKKNKQEVMERVNNNELLLV